MRVRGVDDATRGGSRQPRPGEKERLSDRPSERLRCKWCGRLTRCQEIAPSIPRYSSWGRDGVDGKQ